MESVLIWCVEDVVCVIDFSIVGIWLVEVVKVCDLLIIIVDVFEWIECICVEMLVCLCDEGLCDLVML